MEREFGVTAGRALKKREHSLCNYEINAVFTSIGTLMKTFLAVGCAFLIAGCAGPQKPTMDIYAFNGSRADGVVDIAFQGDRAFTAADAAKGRSVAVEKCSARGYQGASEFGSRRTVCLSSGSLGCAASEMTVKFQCLGNPDAGYTSSAAFARPQSTAASLPQTSQRSREEQLDRLAKENISYEEYQVRYKRIMAD